MAKRAYFAFHYQDVIDFRANVVRNSWVTQDREDAGFFDASLWEEARKTSDLALKRLINSGLQNTSATAVLIGSDTYNRRWVRYEIMKSLEKGNRMLGIHINSIKGKDGKIKLKGPNPFDYLGYKYSDDGYTLYLYEGKNGKWIVYSDIQSYSLKNRTPENLRGKFFKLSDILVAYDWVSDNGYKNLATWLG